MVRMQSVNLVSELDTTAYLENPVGKRCSGYTERTTVITLRLSGRPSRDTTASTGREAPLDRPSSVIIVVLSIRDRYKWTCAVKHIAAQQFAGLAHQEERLSCKEDVVGSIPATGTK